MKITKWFAIVLVFSLALTACKTEPVAEVLEQEAPAATEVVEVEEQPTQEPVADAENEDIEPTEELEEAPPVYFEDQVVTQYATGFTVEYFDTYKIVEVLTPWDFAEETFKYVLVQRGTEAPEGIENVNAYVQIPIETIAPLSTTFLPFIDIYGKIDTVVAVSDGTYVSNPTIIEKTSNGELPAVGYGPSIDVETLLDLNPDLIMTSGYGFPDYDTHPVLIEAGLTTVINGDYMETTPLGRAEWGKFLALFYNTEKEANEFFAQTAAAYNELTAPTKEVESNPTVFLNTAWEGTWYVPGGKSYLANFIADAGGDYLWSDDSSTGSLYLSYEEVLDVAGTGGDIWLNPGGFSFSAADVLMLDERYAEFSAYQNGEMYNNNNKLSEMGGNDFFESGIAYPEVILADLITIFHPELLPDHELQYYLKLN